MIGESFRDPLPQISVAVVGFLCRVPSTLSQPGSRSNGCLSLMGFATVYQRCLGREIGRAPSQPFRLQQRRPIGQVQMLFQSGDGRNCVPLVPHILPPDAEQAKFVGLCAE